METLVWVWLAEGMKIADTKMNLVLAGTGKTGRRVAERLVALGRPARDFTEYARAAAAKGVWTVGAGLEVAR